MEGDRLSHKGAGERERERVLNIAHWCGNEMNSLDFDKNRRVCVMAGTRYR